MKYIRLMLWITIAWWATSEGQAQSGTNPSGEMPGFGLTPRQEEALSKRWIRSQSVVTLYLGESHPIAGQPIHLSGDTVLVYPRMDIPAGGNWQKHLVAVPLAETDSFALQKGGNGILRARKASAYPLQPDLPEATLSARQKLWKASVYRDSLPAAPDLPDAFSHSRLLRSVFPNKHFRISLGVGFGADVVTDDVMQSLLQSPLVKPEQGYGTTTTIELADFAFRFLGRVMVGWQYMARPDYSNIYSYSSGPDSYSDYSYRVDLFEHRIYAEYGIFHVDRYFSRPVEWTAGAGIILARPEKSFYYQYAYFPEDGRIYEDYLFYQMTGRLTGLHLKSALHYFFFPGLSLFAGLEASFYQKWIIPAQALPDAGTGQEITLPQHEISLNRFRFKIGISIFL